METRTTHDNTAKGWFAMSSDPTHNPSSTELQFKTELERELYEALDAIIEFDEAPLNQKRPDVFSLLLMRIRRTLAKARGEQTE